MGLTTTIRITSHTYDFITWKTSVFSAVSSSIESACYVRCSGCVCKDSSVRNSLTKSVMQFFPILKGLSPRHSF